MELGDPVNGTAGNESAEASEASSDSKTQTFKAGGATISITNGDSDLPRKETLKLDDYEPSETPAPGTERPKKDTPSPDPGLGTQTIPLSPYTPATKPLEVSPFKVTSDSPSKDIVTFNVTVPDRVSYDPLELKAPVMDYSAPPATDVREPYMPIPANG